jgi:hypothetical protein
VHEEERFAEGPRLRSRTAPPGSGTSVPNTRSPTSMPRALKNLQDSSVPGPLSHGTSPLGSSARAEGSAAQEDYDQGGSPDVVYTQPREATGGLGLQMKASSARTLCEFLQVSWQKEGPLGIHVDPTGRVAPFPPMVNYLNTLEQYQTPEQLRHTVRIERKRLRDAAKHIPGFEALSHEALVAVRQATGEDDLEMFDAHALRQIRADAVTAMPRRSFEVGSEGGASFGRHRDQHDNPKRSKLRYSLVVTLTKDPSGAEPSAVMVKDASTGLWSTISYGAEAGGAVLIRSQELHSSTKNDRKLGEVLKITFFFVAKNSASLPAHEVYNDHLNRPYFCDKQHRDTASYVLHRLGRHDEELKEPGFATLRDVWSVAASSLVANVAKEEGLAGRQRNRASSVYWRSGGCESFCLQDVIAEHIGCAADACAPRSIFPPTRSCTAEEMVNRMKACPELDRMTWTMTGSTRLVNDTLFPQPRRKSWSVIISHEQDEEASHTGPAPWSNRLFTYSQSYRPPSDWRAAPMPVAVFDLGVACWQAVWEHLSPISQVCPPTGCQLMIYQTLFGACIGRHRDNGLQPPDGSHGRLGNSEDENSQIRGSSVLVFTKGPPMTFALSSPPAHLKPWTATKTEYEIDPELTIPLGDGTLYVLTPRTDEQCCHEAWFEDSVLRRGADVRRAYVFRWLSKSRLFAVP